MTCKDGGNGDELNLSSEVIKTGEHPCDISRLGTKAVKQITEILIEYMCVFSIYKNSFNSIQIWNMQNY